MNSTTYYNAVLFTHCFLILGQFKTIFLIFLSHKKILLAIVELIEQ